MFEGCKNRGLYFVEGKAGKVKLSIECARIKRCLFIFNNFWFLHPSYCRNPKFTMNLPSNFKFCFKSLPNRSLADNFLYTCIIFQLSYFCIISHAFRSNSFRSKMFTLTRWSVQWLAPEIHRASPIQVLTRLLTVGRDVFSTWYGR